MGDYSRFTNVWMKKGFDRDEVLSYIEKNEADHAAALQKVEEELKQAREELERVTAERDSAIRDWNKISKERDDLQEQIDTRYRKYEENYDKIGALVYESRLKGDKIVEDARSQSDKMLGEAKEESDKVLRDARSKADQVLNDADRKATQVLSEADKKADQVLDEADRKASFMESEAHNQVAEVLQDNREEFLQFREILDKAVEQVNTLHRQFSAKYPEMQQIMDKTAAFSAAGVLPDKNAGNTGMVVPVHIEADHVEAGNAHSAAVKEDALNESPFPENKEEAPSEPVFTDAEDLVFDEPDRQMDTASSELEEEAGRHIVRSGSEEKLDEILKENRI